MTDVLIDAAVIERMAADLERIRREFDQANAKSDSSAEACGHQRLGDRVRGFAHNWDRRRQDLVEQIETVQSHLGEISSQFTAVDSDLAHGIEGTP